MQILFQFQKFVQIRCHRGAGTKMYKCLVGSAILQTQEYTPEILILTRHNFFQIVIDKLSLFSNKSLIELGTQALANKSRVQWISKRVNIPFRFVDFLCYTIQIFLAGFFISMILIFKMFLMEVLKEITGYLSKYFFSPREWKYPISKSSKKYV